MPLGSESDGQAERRIRSTYPEYVSNGLVLRQRLERARNASGKSEALRSTNAAAGRDRYFIGE